MKVTPETIATFEQMRTANGTPTVAGCLWLLWTLGWRWEGRIKVGGIRTYTLLDPQGRTARFTTTELRTAAKTQFAVYMKNSQTSAGQSSPAVVDCTP